MTPTLPLSLTTSDRTRLRDLLPDGHRDGIDKPSRNTDLWAERILLDMAPTTVVIANRKGGVGKTLTTIYTSRWLARMGRRVIINDLDPQRGIWDFAAALGRPHGRILKHLAVVVPDASPPFEPDYVLVATPPAPDVNMPAMNTADWLIVPVIPDDQPLCRPHWQSWHRRTAPVSWPSFLPNQVQRSFQNPLSTPEQLMTLDLTLGLHWRRCTSRSGVTRKANCSATTV
jgi:hypothetical protein